MAKRKHLRDGLTAVSVALNPAHLSRLDRFCRLTARSRSAMLRVMIDCARDEDLTTYVARGGDGAGKP